MSARRFAANGGADTRRWRADRDRTTQAEQAAFDAKRQELNAAVRGFQQRFESGERDAVEEYLQGVFERSAYPDDFCVQHAVAFDAAAETVVVDIELPAQDSVPDVVGYKFVAAKNESSPIHMKPKEHDALYDEAVKQTVMRTIHATTRWTP